MIKLGAWPIATFTQCWTIVCDAGPALYQHWMNVSFAGRLTQGYVQMYRAYRGLHYARIQTRQKSLSLLGNVGVARTRKPIRNSPNKA